MIADRLALLRAQIDAELRACGRTPGSVRILAVSKKQPAEAIADAIAAGVTDIGENYVQEAQRKFALLCYPEPTHQAKKHFIGHFQTNKAKAIAQTFDVVQSIDRIDAALALSRAALSLGKQLDVLLQLNISPAERFGIAPEDAPALAERVRSLDGLRFDGVMAIGPLTSDRYVIAEAFTRAAKTFALLGGSTLSIGMSGDWREAVRAGSTMLRIGTAIFGERR